MGECKKCGKCCQEVNFIVPQIKTDRILREYYKARGCTIKDNKIFIPFRCVQLDENNLCKLHGDKKPHLCKSFVGQEGDFIHYKGCGYDD